MEENSKKMTLLKFIIIFLAIIAVLAIVLVVVFKNYTGNNQVVNEVIENVVETSKKEEKLENTVTEEVKDTNEPYEELTVNDHVYYQRLNDKTWDGEYHKDIFYTEAYIEMGDVVTYDEYLKAIDKINEASVSEKIINHYTDKNSNYLILAYATGITNCQIDIVDCIENEEIGMITVFGDETNEGNTINGSGYFIVIPTKMPAGTDIEYLECRSKQEIEELKSKASNN